MSLPLLKVGQENESVIVTSSSKGTGSSATSSRVRTAVACVGKTTIGRRTTSLTGLAFFDLDQEIETFFNTSIERLQERFLTVHSYRNEAAKVLLHILARPEC